ncbi:hypothetical protein ACKFKG_26895 [Phormidesmis sp. 146-35]
MNNIFLKAQLKRRLKRLQATVSLLKETVPEIDWTSLEEECSEIEQAIAAQDVEQLELLGGDDE